MNWSQSEHIGDLASALAGAQSEIRGAVADSDNPFFKSKYADLASVWDACRKQLTSHGLSVVQLPVTTEYGTGVSTVLMHTSGQWIGSTVHAAAKDNGAQAIGSVLTYLRRYSLAAVAGVPQVDDDGELAEGRKVAPKPNTFATTAPPKPAPVPATKPGEVYVTGVREAAGKDWKALYVTFSDGREAGVLTKDEGADGIIATVLDAAQTRKPVLVNLVPSKKDPAKLKFVSIAYAEDVLV